MHPGKIELSPNFIKLLTYSKNAFGFLAAQSSMYRVSYQKNVYLATRFANILRLFRLLKSKVCAQTVTFRAYTNVLDDS